MNFKGNWKSRTYSDICGNFELDVSVSPDPTSLDCTSLDCISSDCEMKLSYDPNSKYRPGETITIPLEGAYRELKENHANYRIVMRQKELDIDQYFSLTMSSYNSIKWEGYLTCVFPVDLVKLFDVTCTYLDIHEINDADIDKCEIGITL